MKNSQAGFGVIEGLLIVVVVGLIGVGSWFAYSSHHKATGVSNASSTTRQGSSQSKTATVASSPQPTASVQVKTTTSSSVPHTTSSSAPKVTVSASPSPAPQPSAAPQPVTTSGSATYNHGTPVPADSVARAKAAGYYCPSWDAAPGTNSAYYCVTLDQ